jgi:hypothetical protein
MSDLSTQRSDILVLLAEQLELVPESEPWSSLQQLRSLSRKSVRQLMSRMKYKTFKSPKVFQ